jgi:hypothetical protein
MRLWIRNCPITESLVGSSIALRPNDEKIGVGVLHCVLFSCAGRHFRQQGPSVPGNTPADAPQVQQEIHPIESMLAKLPDRGAALFLLAHDYAHLARECAFITKECTSLDEGIDPEGNVEFRRLGENPEFHKLIERVHRHYPAVVLTSFHSLCISEGRCCDPPKHLEGLTRLRSSR